MRGHTRLFTGAAQEAADKVHSHDAAAQLLLKLLPPGGRASKARGTLGRMAGTLAYGSPATNYPGMKWEAVA